MTAASQQNYFSDADVQKWRTADYHEVISLWKTVITNVIVNSCRSY